MFLSQPKKKETVADVLWLDWLNPDDVEQHKFLTRFGVYLRLIKSEAERDQFFKRLFRIWFHFWPPRDEDVEMKRIKDEIFYYGLNRPNGSTASSWRAEMWKIEQDIGIDFWDAIDSSPLF